MRYVRWRHISLVFQGAMNSLDPVQRVDVQFAEAIRLHSPSAELHRGEGAHGGAARHGRADRGARAPLRPPALGRPAPAGDDRARAGVQPVAGDRRRADHRPRRGHAGAGAAAPRAPARAPWPGADPDLARPRRAGRDLRPHRDHVRGADRRDRARSRTVFSDPQHPYTKRLLETMPTIGGNRGLEDPIPGGPPDPGEPPPGCRFQPRCPYARGALPGRRTRRCARSARPTRRRCHFAPWAEWPERGPLARRGRRGRPDDRGRSGPADGGSRPLRSSSGSSAGRRARSTASRSSGARARSWASWASPAAASQRSRGRCCSLVEPAAGELALDGQPLERQGHLNDLRRRLQMIFQDPYQTLNPRQRVRTIVAEPLVVQGVARLGAPDRGEAGAGGRRPRPRALRRALPAPALRAASASGWRSPPRSCSSPRA